MKIKKSDRRAYVSKASALKRMTGRGMLLEGSLNASMRGWSELWQLTDKADGRMRTLYVPARHAAEVTEALALWKEVGTAPEKTRSGLSAPAFDIIKSMGKIFNIEGPCNSERHYMLPATKRMSDVMCLVEEGR